MKKMVQFFKEKRLYRYSFIAATVLVSAAVVYAATVPYTFTSGTVAKSSEVNSNFSYLADRSWEKSGSNLYYSSGNVGIGTSSPQQKLHISDSSIGSILVDSSTQGAIIVRGYSDGTTYSSLYLGADNLDYSQNSWVIAHRKAIGDPTEDALVIAKAPGSGQIAMTIKPDGNVGLGTSSPNYPLHMASGAYVTTGGVWTNASSRTYKEHIAELTSNEAISAFQGLKAVTYNYKVDKDEKHVGFIAEDVPAILATKDRKGVSPMDVVALLTKVVQEQQKTIAVLAKEVEGLKKGRM